MALGNIKSAQELSGSLLSLRYAAIYDIFGQICLHEFIKNCHKGTNNLKELATILPEGKLTFDSFVNEVNSLGEKALVETKRNANRALTRNLLKEVFRLAQSYCSDTNQLEEMESKSWYQFTRLIVNSMSHDFKWRFHKKDKKHLPITYKKETLELNVDGQDIHMRLQVLIELVDEIISFSKSEIK
ncbi:hypothetical protein J4E06_05445 [Muricauda sp. NFXS6]|uniref:hypothetical protein n=1 Tax=Allomuricauda sp. NFXS6 TaxID=2819094 RepID=UPI0032DE4E10